MNKFYLIIPILACLVFGGFYLRFDRNFKAEQERKEEVARAEVKEKQRRDTEARQSAYQAAIEAQALRKKEREERERLEEEKKQLRLDLEDKRLRAFDERRRMREQVERVRKEVAGVQEEVTKIEAQKKTYEDELAFLKEYVATTKANMQGYYDLIEKIANAEKAAKAAADAAALAATKK
jgi:chromosome segregation ATPase